MKDFKTLDLKPFGGVYITVSEKKFWGMLFLVTCLFISAISVVYDQAINRIMFSKLQQLQKQQDALRLRWGQLLLEQSAWGTQPRVQAIAQNDLDMQYPESKKNIIVRE